MALILQNTNPLALSDYEATGDVVANKKSLILRAFETKSKRMVMIKLPQPGADYGFLQKVFKNELEIANLVSSDRVIKYVNYVEINGKPCLVMEDFGAVSLNSIIPKNGFNIEDFLTFSIPIVEGLRDIHNSRIIHKDINPNNILVNIQTGEIKITDFGCSARSSKEILLEADILDNGTLEYISPEQTGRISGVVTQQTDMYSLGITFFQMLTGSLPFNYKDPAELLFAHLTKTPPWPLDDIHPFLKQIVNKLFNKSPESRYKSCVGILNDLLLLKQSLCDHLEITNAPGINDQTISFHLSEKLYGRDEELKILQDTWETDHSGHLRLVIVKGYSGIGKSSLITEFGKYIAFNKGYLVSGKFDQFQRNIPYSGLAEGFRKLLRQFIAEGDESVRYWRKKFSEALGSNAQLIIAVIPELELIIDKQPGVEELNATAARNRFVSVFRIFIKAIASNNVPVVIFLDDLQWADPSTLQLILNMVILAKGNDASNILMLGSFRDNEVMATDVLSITLEQIANNGVEVETINLHNLGVENVTQMVSESLQTNEPKVAELSKLIHRKTAGNPFFVKQFLYNLYEEGLVDYSSVENRWLWDINKIESKNYTDNVAEFITNKLKRLNAEAVLVLNIASCIGNVFDLELLAKIKEAKLEIVNNQLAELVDEGLILRVQGKEKNSFRFLHDSIQTAANSLLMDAEREEIQYKIGKTILLSTEEIEDTSLFNAVSQINQVIPLLTEKEKHQLAELNYKVAVKAKASNAYSAALNYLEIAIHLIPKQAWSNQYNLISGIYSLATECAYLAGNYDLMDEYGAVMIEKAETVLDKIAIYEIIIQSYGARSKMSEALNTAKKALALLDIKIPGNPTKGAVMIDLVKTIKTIGFKKVSDLETLPLMKDPLKLAAIRILISSASSAYLAEPDLFPIIISLIVRLSVKHGNTKFSAYGFCAYGVILSGVFGKIKKGYDYGVLAVTLLKKYNTEDINAKTMFAFNGFSRHWKEPLRKYLPEFIEYYKSALSSGDLEYAMWNLFMYSAYSLLSGYSLKAMDEKFQSYSAATTNYRQVNALLNLWKQQSNILTGKIPEDDNHIDKLGNSFIAEKFYTGIGEYHIIKSMTNYYFGHYQKSLSYSMRAARYEENLLGLVFIPVRVFFHGLSLMKVTNKISFYQSIRLKRVLSKFRKWGKESEGTYLHKFYLLCAEYFRITNKDIKAVQHYNLAIELAKKNGYINDEALAYDLAGDYYKSKQIKDLSEWYYGKAYTTYKQWEAEALAERVKEKMQNSIEDSDHETLKTSVSSVTASTEHLSKTIDVTSILKASQAISEIIEPSALLQKMIHIIRQNAGAEKIAIILKEDNDFRVKAMLSPEEGNKIIIKDDPFENADLSISVLKYVIRTKESVVLDNATTIGNFTNDDYIIKNKSLSILCFPLIHKNELTGIVYLENNLIKGAFTSDRIEVLRLLSSQMVISEENAKLFFSVKELNNSYERFIPKEFLRILEKKSILQIFSGDQVEKEITVMFSDIRNFTGMSELIPPGETFMFLNKYLKNVTPAITGNKGIIDKYMGDGIMALFPDSPDDGLQAAIEMIDRIKDFNNKNLWGNNIKINAGFGIHTGKLILGTLGSDNRLSTTVVGDTVNLASRLESATKVYNLPLLVSEEAVRRLKNRERFHLREIDQIQVKGKKIPVTIYEEYSADDEKSLHEKEEVKPYFNEALSWYKLKNYKEAYPLFQYCKKKNEADHIIELYLSKCAEPEQLNISI